MMMYHKRQHQQKQKRILYYRFLWIVGFLLFLIFSVFQNFIFIKHLDEYNNTENNNHNGEHNNNGRILLQQQQSTTVTTTKTKIDASIVIQLSGEMGNNLNKIAMGRVIQLIANEKYNLTTNLVFKHQEDNMKWKLAKRDITKCFPNLKQFNFEAGNSHSFKEKIIEQKIKYGIVNSTKLMKLLVTSDNNNNSNNNTTSTSTSSLSSSTNQVVQLLNDLVVQQQQQQEKENNNNNNIVVGDRSSLDTIYEPFIFVDTMINYEYMEQYRKDFIQFFQFDDHKCCKEIPNVDESVFHFRNFQTELKGATSQLGFTELSPQKTANELFGQQQQQQHLKGSSKKKIAITTRFDNDITQQYVYELTNNGYNVRVVSGQTGVQDFCFLKSTKKELIGMKKSSYFKWAAYLSDSVQKVRTYSLLVDNHHNDNEDYQWKNPDLNNRYIHTVFDGA